MRKNFKRTLALGLAVATIFGNNIIPAKAENSVTSDNEEITVETAEQELAADSVISEAENDMQLETDSVISEVENDMELETDSMVSEAENNMQLATATASAARKTYSGTSSKDAGTTGKTYAPSIQLANTEKYRKVDYTFLKSYKFGSTYDSDVILTFLNVDEMAASTFGNIREGAIVKTLGYYKKGDGGSATYEISKTAGKGSITLSNGLYANLIPDTYTDSEGNKWYVASVKQFGAKGDGKAADNTMIVNALNRMNEIVDKTEDIARGTVFIPAGEYKCEDKIDVGVTNLNIVGCDEDTTLFTDNDYRKGKGYSEFFFSVWGTSNTFISHFVIQAREVDLYHYMRQFVLTYSTDVCVYEVDMLIPKECYNNYYKEDKQYSNFCCYTGNTNITVDGCKMEQMTSTYRGANVGVLDIWNAGEKNICIMNCDLYGDARDEQIGFFGTSNTNSHLNNVEFINNTVHSYKPRYGNVVGHATMRFTIAYNDSNDVSNIHIAGNHFVVECDSKFITFGNVKECVIEDNIIEQLCTYSTWSIIFESNTFVDEKDVVLKHNDIFVSSKENKGKGNLISGNCVFDNNRLIFDKTLVFGVLGSNVNNNEVVGLCQFGRFSTGHNVTGNTIYAYQGFGTCGNATQRQAEIIGGSEEGTYNFNNNTIYNYEYADTTGNFQTLFSLNSGSGTKIVCNGNKYYAPNVKYTKTQNYACVYKNPDEQLYYLKIWRNNTDNKNLNIELKNNIFQGVIFEPMSKYDEGTTVDASNNTVLPQTGDPTVPLTKKVELTNGGKVVTDISTTASSIDFDDIEYIDVLDADGNVTGQQKVNNKDVTWYTSIEEIGVVSKDGVVTRKNYGDIVVYCVPLDGSGVYGKCNVHFIKAKAQSIKPQYTSKELEVGFKDYIQCEFTPSDAKQELIYSSSNEEVITVSKVGVVEAIAKGSADVTCSTSDGSGVKTTIHYTVGATSVKRVNMYITKGEDVMSVGETCQMKTYFTPYDATINATISKWESLDESVAKVSSTGLVTAVGGGATNIRAYSGDGKYFASYKVYVKPTAVKNLKAENLTEKSVKLSWEGTCGVNGYKLYQWDNSTSEWKLLITLNSNQTSHTINNLDKDTEYKYCVRAYVSKYIDWSRTDYYEASDVTLTVKTLNFIPVTDIWLTAGYLSMTVDDNTWNPNISFNVKNSPDNKDLEYYIEDTSIAEIIKCNYDEGLHRYSPYILAKKAGMTYLVIKAKDGAGCEKRIPIGVFDKVSINDVTGVGSYGTATISFSGIEDESSFDGYYIRRIRGQAKADPVYIPKTGAKTYSYDYTTNLVDGEKYGFYIGVYSEIDGICYEREKTKVTDIQLPEKVEVTGINVSNTAVNVVVGENKTITASVVPSNASITTLDWNIADSNVANIQIKKDSKGNEYGLIYGLKEGTTTLTLVSKNGEFIRKTINIVVSKTSTIGWKKVDGKWCYINDKGNIQKGWLQLNGKWYYFSELGIMQTGFIKINDKYYYMSASGAMLLGWQKINNRWFYFNKLGEMQTGWQKINNKWFYFSTTGVMVTGWKKIDSSWYYFEESGIMQTGWVKYNNNWFYLGKSGVMQTGWQQINGNWYYFDSQGIMQASKWIGNYYVKSNGAMAVSEWVDNGKYYVDADGLYVKGAKK